jgi:hypothetical protein
MQFCVVASERSPGQHTYAPWPGTQTKPFEQSSLPLSISQRSPSLASAHAPIKTAQTPTTANPDNKERTTSRIGGHFFTNAPELKRESWPARLGRGEMAPLASWVFGLTKVVQAGPLLAQIPPLAHHAAQALLTHFRGTAHLISRHTGIPALFVAAALIVASWRMARRLARVTVEVCVVALLLLALTKLGVVSW